MGGLLCGEKCQNKQLEMMRQTGWDPSQPREEDEKKHLTVTQKGMVFSV